MTYDLGILGGGQLARMTIQAAQRMGLDCLSLDPGDDTPASQIADSIIGELSDPEAVAVLFERCRRLTLENEFIPADVIRTAMKLAERDEDCLIPGVDALETIQDKLHQRRAYAKFGAPSPEADEIEAAHAQFGFPLMLKARFGGYDGKGTLSAETQEDLDRHRPRWEIGGWLAERKVNFVRELAVMVCRSPRETLCFPTMETIQSNHVCDLVFPAGVDASRAAIAAVEAVNGFGLFGVELFELQDGSFQINEIAPRPHNTGHYTLDWGGVSQFEQHVRLAMGWPCAEIKGEAACMANLLGVEKGSWRKGMEAMIETEPNAKFHWYGKRTMKPGRKMGHINAVGPDAIEIAQSARRAFYEGL